MKIRTDVAEMLRAGHPDHEISRTLHTDGKAVAAARRALHIPRARPGRKPASSPQDLFRQRTETTADGHMRWTGYVKSDGVPAVRWAGRPFTAYRIAFVMRYGRAPIGRVQPGCGVRGCVAPDHVQDRPMRERDRTAYNAIFGAPS